MQNDIYSCIVVNFDEFNDIMDEIFHSDNSYGFYWDVTNDGDFYFRTINFDTTRQDIDVEDIGRYLGILQRIYSLHYYSGAMYILFK